jgi:hypothetical protein
MLVYAGNAGDEALSGIGDPGPPTSVSIKSASHQSLKNLCTMI